MTAPDSPFTPKHQSSDSLEYFTDREDALARFVRHVEVKTGEVLPVLHFFGMGGVGKTCLVRKLESELCDQPQRIPHVRVEIDSQGPRDPLRWLTTLRMKLGGFGIPFDRFDLVSGVLAATDGGGDADLFNGNPWAKAVLEVAGTLPVVGSPITGVKAFVDAFLTQYPHWRARLEKIGGNEYVDSLKDKQHDELVYALADALAADLSDGAQERPGKQCRAVIFLDGYEALWTGAASPTSAQGREVDEWVRELNRCLHEHGNTVLLVIAGRDQLRWPEVDEEWGKLGKDQLERYLEAHPMDGLSPEDTQRLLAKRGVGHGPEVAEPTPLQAAIIDCARLGLESKGCHPMLLDLCADIVGEERGPEGAGVDPPPEWFSSVPHETVAVKLRKLAVRFLKSLSQEMEDLVKALSVPRWFDKEVVEARLGGPDRATTACKRLRQYSFTTSRWDEDGDSGTLTFHDLMRRALQATTAEAELVEKHKWFRGYWITRHEEGDEAAEAEAWYHRLHLEPEEAVNEWVSMACAAEEERDGARARTLISWLGDVDLMTKDWRTLMGDERWADALAQVASGLDEVRAFAFSQSPLLDRIMEYYRACLQVYDVETSPSKWTEVSVNLGQAHLAVASRGLLDMNNVRAAIERFDSASQLCTRDQQPEEWARLQVLLGNAYQRLIAGEPGYWLAQAAERYTEALNELSPSGQPEAYVDAIRALGELAVKLAPVDAAMMGYAVKHLKVALSACDPTSTPKVYAEVIYELAKAHCANEEWDAAIDCYTEALHLLEPFPEEWAIVSAKLAEAHFKRGSGSDREDLRSAADHLDNAISVFTEESHPLAFMHLDRNRSEIRAILGSEQ